MGVTVAFVPLLPKAKLAAKAVTADIAKKWPDFDPPAASVPNPGQMSFDYGDDYVLAQLVPAPIPWGDLDIPCRSSILWPDAEKALKPHAGHLIVTTPCGDDPVARAKLVTSVLAGILGSCPQAVGVYWGDAALVVPSKLFQEMAQQILPDGLPLFLWMHARTGRNEDGTTSGFTTGLAGLGHKEFETDNASDDPGTLRERLFNLAEYVLTNGPVIKDGNTVGADANEKIQVKYGESRFGQDGEVMRLDYQPARKKRRL